MKNIIIFLEKKNKRFSITEMHNIGVKKIKKILFLFFAKFGEGPLSIKAV